MIRIATIDDIQAINAIRKQVNDIHANGRPDVFKPGFNEEMQAQANLFLSNADTKIYLSENDDQVTGMIMIDYVTKPESSYSYERRYSHVKEICVDEKWRHHGIGHELIEAAKADAKQQGIDTIELGVWSFNDAIDFYKNEGFEVSRTYLELKV